MRNTVMHSVQFLVEHHLYGAAAILMFKHNIPFDQAYHFIFEKRPKV